MGFIKEYGKKNSIIMIVDDNPAHVQLLSAILQEEGYEIYPVLNGKIALETGQLHPPDLILLDINMSEMNGFEVCKAFKSDLRLVEIPIIFISAAVETADKLKAFQEGGVDYITEPFQPLEVLARVKTHLSLANAKTELRANNEALETIMEKLNLAQSHLIQSEKMSTLGLLTAGIAHELNNPLNFISGSVQGLRKTVSPIEKLIKLCEFLLHSPNLEGKEKLQEWIEKNQPADLLETINELVKNACFGAERVSEIVQGLRIFSRLDEAEIKRIDLHENIDSALLLLRNRYKEIIKIIKNYGPFTTWFCQPGKLNQVFMNLFSNSIDAIFSKKELTQNENITITTRIEERDSSPWAIIEISDTGIGMSDNVIKHLFQPFFTTKDVGKGVGLGLAIAHGIILDHRGTIEVKSSLNKGSFFRILLPHREFKGEGE
ncbi:MAG: hybrid sensor histidine kinase/response regulator [Candidatus Riflebacteria bacterium]|nr:hybrid sensor histidine kinase/response regulator [Candidatus Riflebacteria bacterium]